MNKTIKFVALGILALTASQTLCWIMVFERTPAVQAKGGQGQVTIKEIMHFEHEYHDFNLKEGGSSFLTGGQSMGGWCPWAFEFAISSGPFQGEKIVFNNPYPNDCENRTFTIGLDSELMGDKVFRGSKGLAVQVK